MRNDLISEELCKYILIMQNRGPLCLLMSLKIKPQVSPMACKARHDLVTASLFNLTYHHSFPPLLQAQGALDVPHSDQGSCTLRPLLSLFFLEGSFPRYSHNSLTHFIYASVQMSTCGERLLRWSQWSLRLVFALCVISS